MSLRARLLIVIALLAVTYVATAVVVVRTQRSLLIEQVDRRISALPPRTVSFGANPPPESIPGDAFESPDGQPESPYSNLYVGSLNSDGTTTDILIGTLLETTPDVAAAVDEANGGLAIVTIRDEGSSIRFRAAVLPQLVAETYLVAAEPLTETDAAIERLERTLVIAGVAIAVVLGTAFFWVQHLGLLPIARVTSTAEAIAAGERTRRVDVRDKRTEAGKLGLAFNVMLDERDAEESRLRQFVADASHELRTPLTSVRGYLELYRQGAFREQHQLDDVVRRLSAEAARMNGLVEDLLSLASLDEGRPHLFESVDLGRILRDVIQDAQATQAERQIELIAPDKGLTAVGDSALLVQLAGILVANALAHTPVNVPVTVTAREEGAFVTMIVADRGPGLDAEAAARVFDRFWRGASGRSRGPSTCIGYKTGAGLGLAIARSIADVHGGTITLDTAPGKGCTFTVRLPVERVAGPTMWTLRTLVRVERSEESVPDRLSVDRLRQIEPLE